MLENPFTPSSASMRPSYAGIWVPIVTPFADDAARSVDYGALYALVVRYRGLGVAGFVACGSTGEAAALTDQEQADVLDTVRAAADGLPVVMGLSGSALAPVRERMLRLAGHRPAAFLIPAPSYIRPSQAGLIEYFTALADASRVPVLLYDIPYRTGATIETETLLALAAHPNIHGIKDCGGDADKTQRVIADGRLQVLAGEDAQVFGTLCAGGVGAIIAAAHVRTELFVEMARAVQEQRLNDARRLHHALAPVIRLLFAQTNPGPLKAWLAAEGLIRNVLRAPMVGASEELGRELVEVVGRV
ncbi:4-hydroxy-tetrahydrodipicolinate synthase [Ralstonia mannitolilytica]|uniref:4-hydroxy-tetrahydrodipicolinate synthase n=1 Tax=Ralstonia mannitolilytica TaxID=105219 RepID=A0AAD2EJ03_9RALS|nr:4-hydroxy-tetrahydrodipicolinate synthase [Ralstonia mannitolilytica]MBY4717762.1 4-hydroxy-tetrahydrodipicolinate synthase [Ralstonia mannitolilytica]CAJ0685404.1 4-hydroxy-tetrahydrodipicolinate synthase [Ralstonia mannitolilytica]CAJ0804626.1 4-hydroxy-tetrahydrodipicolinate synthase [Ralstonia mannitolilytica]CAJ0888838.1 4-hydroxy-tetrahydrodipicolinate synthase [Ralstonia mannitolilytica]CAJ0896967.1 4-hydroxy-tetrahydrodipicolinate synthase [Ralstonia mannitolilytica]